MLHKRFLIVPVAAALMVVPAGLLRTPVGNRLDGVNYRKTGRIVARTTARIAVGAGVKLATRPSLMIPAQTPGED